MYHIPGCHVTEIYINSCALPCASVIRASAALHIASRSKQCTKNASTEENKLRVEPDEDGCTPEGCAVTPRKEEIPLEKLWLPRLTATTTSSTVHPSIHPTHSLYLHVTAVGYCSPS